MLAYKFYKIVAYCRIEKIFHCAFLRMLNSAPLLWPHYFIEHQHFQRVVKCRPLTDFKKRFIDWLSGFFLLILYQNIFCINQYKFFQNQTKKTSENLWNNKSGFQWNIGKRNKLTYFWHMGVNNFKSYVKFDRSSL